MILIKPGVTFVPAFAGFCILEAIKVTAERLDLDLRITSGSDGEHSGPQDPHKKGEAYDVGSKEFGASTKAKIAESLARLLGDRFYVLLENPGQVNEHFHIQRRKDTTFGIGDLIARPTLQEWQV